MGNNEMTSDSGGVVAPHAGESRIPMASTARITFHRSFPQQHDFHSINIEDIAYRSSTEMVIGLRAPLTGRTYGNAYYFVVTNMVWFLYTSWPAGASLAEIAGPYEMNLNGLGIRSIKWCPQLGPGGAGRYVVQAGNANGGALAREYPIALESVPIN